MVEGSKYGVSKHSKEEEESVRERSKMNCG